MAVMVSFPKHPTIVTDSKFSAKVLHLPPKIVQREEIPTINASSAPYVVQAQSLPLGSFAATASTANALPAQELVLSPPAECTESVIDPLEDAETNAWQQLRKFVTVIADTAMSSRRKIVESCVDHINMLQQRTRCGLEGALAEKMGLQGELDREIESRRRTEQRLEEALEEKAKLQDQLQAAQVGLRDRQDLEMRLGEQQKEMKGVLNQIESLQSRLVTARKEYESELAVQQEALANAASSQSQLLEQLQTRTEEHLQEKQQRENLQEQLHKASAAVVEAQDEVAMERRRHACKDQLLQSEQEVVEFLRNKNATLERELQQHVSSPSSFNGMTVPEQRVRDELASIQSEQRIFEEAAQRAARRLAEVQQRLGGDPGMPSVPFATSQAAQAFPAVLPRAVSFPTAMESTLQQSMSEARQQNLAPRTCSFDLHQSSLRTPAQILQQAPPAEPDEAIATNGNVDLHRSQMIAAKDGLTERTCQPIVCTTYASLEVLAQRMAATGVSPQQPNQLQQQQVIHPVLSRAPEVAQAPGSVNGQPA